MHAIGRLTAALLVAISLSVPALAQGMPTLASGPGERILDFDADITVADTGDLHVVESIKVRVKGEQIQRGIIRTLPIAEDADSYVVLSVTRDGHDEPFSVDVSGGTMNIRIGNPDVLLTPGDATYQITYKAEHRIANKDGVRTLDWDVTGHAWGFGIDRASASVHPPAGATATNLRLFTGPDGSTDSDGTIAQGPSGAIEAHTRLPLKPGNGLTIVAEWPVPGGPASPTAPDPRRSLDGMLQFYNILGHVFVLPLIAIVL